MKRKKRCGKVLHFEPRRELTLDDIQDSDGVYVAGGWIIDYPLPKKPSLELLKAAHAAIIEFSGFYSYEIPFHPPLFCKNGYPNPRNPELLDPDYKEKMLGDLTNLIDASVNKLWEICLAIAEITEQNAIDEYNNLLKEKQSPPDDDIPF